MARAGSGKPDCLRGRAVSEGLPPLAAVRARGVATDDTVLLQGAVDRRGRSLVKPTEAVEAVARMAPDEAIQENAKGRRRPPLLASARPRDRVADRFASRAAAQHRVLHASRVGLLPAAQCTGSP